jgi:fatty acid synthase
VLQSLIQYGLDNNEIVPLNIDRMYHQSKLEDAIRYMGGGNHMGKIIVQMSKSEDDIIKPQFHTNGTHLITGGMGGFGLELADWLVARGAAKVLLMGRNGVTNLYQKRKLDNCVIEYVKGDITNEEDVRRVFADNVIAGVWHLAMKLNDQLYTNLNETTWNDTISVKERGAEYLDKYCPEDALFVCWSSISSLFGNAGQTNYAHGNFMMERLCRERRNRNKHGLAICWGAIDNIGYLSQENSKINKLMFLPQNIDDCLNDLHQLMKSDASVVSCYKLNDAFNDVDSSKTETLLDAVLSIIGFDNIDNIDKSTTLTDLGMDSLQSASVKGVLKKFGKDVKAIDVYKLRISDIM